MSDLSPGAQLITEVIKSAEKASALGLSTKYIAEILEDVTKDLKGSDADTHRAEIDAAVAAERERCLQIAISKPVEPPASMDEDEAEYWWQGGHEIGAAIAAAIRKRGQP